MIDLRRIKCFMKEKFTHWAKSVAAVLVTYGVLCAVPFIIAPLVGAASAAALGYGEVYETVAAFVSIIAVLIWDLRRRRLRKAKA